MLNKLLRDMTVHAHQAICINTYYISTPHFLLSLLFSADSATAVLRRVLLSFLLDVAHRDSSYASSTIGIRC